MLGSLGIGTSAQYSLIPTEGLSTENIPSEDFFYVNLSAGYYYGEGFDPLDAIIYAMDDGPGTDCKISVNEESTEDLYCILDVMEGDLFFHKLVLEYNIPSGMCDYSGFIVPYHLNQATAKGPEEVSQCKFLTEGNTYTYRRTGSAGVTETEQEQIETEERFCKGQCNTLNNRCIKDNEDVTSEETCNTKSECESADCGKKRGEWLGCTDEDGDAVTSTNCDDRSKCEDSSNNCGNTGVAGTWLGCTDEDGDDVSSNTNCNTENKCEALTNNCGGGDDGAGKWHEKYLTEWGCEDEGSGHDEVQEICSNYDKSEQDLGNCCFGEYKVYTGRNAEPSSQGEWGGNFKECIGGPGRFSWDSHNKTGEPITEVTNTKEDGLKEEYELNALINIYDGHKGSNKKPPSFITANYWEEAEEKVFLTSESKLKVYFPKAPTENNFTKDDKRGNPYFVWTCFDRAKEIKHRIILLIREWNTQKEYNKFKETLGSSGDPDIVGEEGDLCDYYTSDENLLFERDSYCNDLLDLDDWQTDEPGTYPEVKYTDSN